MVQDNKKYSKGEKFLKKCDGPEIKISAQLEHFSVLVMNGHW